MCFQYGFYNTWTLTLLYCTSRLRVSLRQHISVPFSVKSDILQHANYIFLMVFRIMVFYLCVTLRYNYWPYYSVCVKATFFLHVAAAGSQSDNLRWNINIVLTSERSGNRKNSIFEVQVTSLILQFTRKHSGLCVMLHYNNSIQILLFSSPLSTDFWCQNLCFNKVFTIPGFFYVCRYANRFLFQPITCKLYNFNGFQNLRVHSGEVYIYGCVLRYGNRLLFMFLWLQYFWPMKFF